MGYVMEIAVRAYNRLRNERTRHSGNYPRCHDALDYSRILALDCETRVSESQALVSGSAVIMRGEIVEQLYLFYNPAEVTDDEFKILQGYCAEDPTIKLCTLKDFVEKVFYPTVYRDKVPCIGFSLCFDLSRLALDFGYAKGWMRGGFTLKLSEDDKWPAIRVKHMDASESRIQFSGTQYDTFKGFFIDCQNISMMFLDDKHVSLKKACEHYNKKHQKLEVSEHGKITKDYITYNIEDTLATAELFTHLKAEYDRFGVSLPLPDVFSSASIGKSVLRDELGITAFAELNPDFPPEVYGKIVQAFYGGRCECRLRRRPAKVAALDFVSMYPTLFNILGLYNFLIAERIDYFDDTENVRKLLDAVTLEDLRNPDVWKQLSVIVEVLPDNDLLPVRAAYTEGNFTVGFNYFSSKEALYYGLPSVILSKLLTGKTPSIKSALRFKPVGRQKSLKKAKILGIEVDPEKDNVFKLLVEAKARSKLAGDGRDKHLKIVVNSTSFGINLELNPEDKKSDVAIYSGNETFHDFKRFEAEGRYFNPVIAVLICDGAKLLLGLGDCVLKKHGETPLYLDTDSQYIPPQYTKELIEFFDPLNPYDKSVIKHLLKPDEEDIWFYGLGTKRYVLYQIDEKGDFVIKDAAGEENYSLHGLGHLLNPFGKETKRWQKEIWLDILRLEYGKIGIDDLLDKYRPFYAVSQFTVSTANLMHRFKLLNKGKGYNDGIKPFSFFLIGFGNYEGVKPIAPFSYDSQAMPYSKFINYRTGELLEGQQYFKSLADELWSYLNHPEAKLEGDIGMLERRRITANKNEISHIGKEADRIEENLSGLNIVSCNTYANPKHLEEVFSRTWKEVKTCGIPESQFYALKKQFKEGKRLKLSNKTMNRIKCLRSEDKNGQER